MTSSIKRTKIPTASYHFNEFSTERLPFAVFLHAAQRLQFLRCDPGEKGKLRFVFADSHDLSSQFELEFDRGAEVAATDLFASQKYLRRKMTELLKNRNGVSEY